MSELLDLETGECGDDHIRIVASLAQEEDENKDRKILIDRIERVITPRRERPSAAWRIVT
jgi:hypothetical protein